MKKESLQKMYDKIITTNDMDERIQKHILEHKKGQVCYIQYTYKLAVIFLAVIVVMQVHPIKAAVQKVITHFSNQIVYFTQNDEEKVIHMQGDYLAIKATAPKDMCKMNSVLEVSNELGISLLQSSEAYEMENCIFYHPYISKNNRLNGVMLINHCYAMGDLENVTLETSAFIDEQPMILYQDGEEYKSPISMQIKIRTNQAEGVDYNNHELEYAGANWDLTIERGIYDINLYEIQKLGVTAVLYSVKSDGPQVWRLEEETEFTTAIFMFDGVEYCYCGAVSQSTMASFLETLQ